MSAESPMRICIVSYYDLITKDTGGAVRTYNLAKNLAEQGHEVIVITPGQKEKLESSNGLIIRRIRGRLPFGILKVASALLGVSNTASLYLYDLSFLQKAYPTFLRSEIVQIDTPVPLAGFVTFFLRKIFHKPVVVDSHDVFQALRVEYSNILRKMIELPMEKIAYGCATLVLTVSQKDRMLLARDGIVPSKIVVIPNGVDVAVFSQQKNKDEVRNHYDLKDSFRVIFVGNMTYSPNQEAVKLIETKIAPKVSREIRNVTFIMVGRKPPRLPATSNMLFTGVVPKITRFLSASDVAIAPLLHGSGTRLKVLEYLSCGLPVVSTSVGIEGLDIKDGVHLLIEDDMDKFSAKVIELLRDEKLRKSLGDSGRELVVKEYDWHEIGKVLSSSLNLICTG
jgi:glycosyltransferase involved in cell wall biosynthesis